jgi:hypothetical protein
LDEGEAGKEQEAAEENDVMYVVTMVKKQRRAMFV